MYMINEHFWTFYYLKFIVRGRFKSCFPHKTKTSVKTEVFVIFWAQKRGLNVILNVIGHD